MVGVALTALVGLLAVLLRGTDSVSQRSIALQLARSQIESIKNQAYTSTVGAYATITPAFSEYQISLSGSEITAGFLQQVDVTVTYPDGTTTLSGYKTKSFPPIIAKPVVSDPTPTPIPGTTQHVYYLHNNPTPPVGDTSSQADLPLDTTVPTAFTHDSDRDSSEGLVVGKGGSGPTESNLTRYQNWLTGAFVSTFLIQGDVEVRLWSAIKGFDLAKTGDVTVYLREYNGATYGEIANATLLDTDWQKGVNNFVEAIITVPSVNYTIASGNFLEVKVIVGSGAADDMWFAYDTTAFDSRVFVPEAPAPTATPTPTPARHAAARLLRPQQPHAADCGYQLTGKPAYGQDCANGEHTVQLRLGQGQRYGVADIGRRLGRERDGPDEVRELEDQRLRLQLPYPGRRGVQPMVGNQGLPAC